MRLRTTLLPGLIALSTAAHAQPDPRQGQKLYGQCAACHAGNESIGPDLVGVVGRKAGSRAGFRYSPALKGANFVWNAATLRAFLHNPKAAVPGNRMPYGGMASDRDLDDLIAYLSGRK